MDAILEVQAKKKTNLNYYAWEIGVFVGQKNFQFEFMLLYFTFYFLSLKLNDLYIYSKYFFLNILFR
jgi:hypothetical protein